MNLQLSRQPENPIYFTKIIKSINILKLLVPFYLKINQKIYFNVNDI